MALNSSTGFAAFRSSPSKPKLRQDPLSPRGWGPHVPSRKSGTTEADKLRETFRKLLLHRYHTVIAAWTALDTELQGRLSYYQFLAACKRFGYNGESRKLWEALDTDRSGFVSLYEIDAPTARLLESFAVHIWAASGSLQAAWDQHFNRRGLGRCTPASFTAGCKAIGFTGDIDTVYDLLNTTHSTTSIGPDNFDFLKMWFASKKAADKVSAFHPHIDQETVDLRAAVAAAAKAGPMKRVAGARELTPKDKFKRLLINSYGNFVRAWREGLDTDRNGRLDYEEFRTCCADIGYPGPRKEVWDLLDVDGSGMVSLGEIDRSTADLLEGFFACIMAKYSSWHEAWAKHMDHKGLDRVTHHDFREACTVLGYGGNIDKLFECLDTDNVKYLSYSSCSWIAGGESVESSPLWENVGDFKITGQFKKTTKSQQRRVDHFNREERVRQRAFESRNRGEILPDPDRPARLERSMTFFKETAAIGVTSAFAQTPTSTLRSVSQSPSKMMASTGDTLWSSMSGSLSDSSPKNHRFAHSAARYHEKDPFANPPPPSAPAAPTSKFRARMDKHGYRVPWSPAKRDGTLRMSMSLPNFASTIRSDPGQGSSQW